MGHGRGMYTDTLPVCEVAAEAMEKEGEAEMSKTVNVLGTEYALILKGADDDPKFEMCGGYCDAFAKEIIVATFKPSGDPMETKNLSAITNLNVRHEIVHAFLYESGLYKNTLTAEGAWAANEEIVDWIALQGQKIYAAWKEAGAL